MTAPPPQRIAADSWKALARRLSPTGKNRYKAFDPDTREYKRRRKITDKLPKNYDKASEKVDAPSTITGSIIKNGEVTIAKLPVGTKATIKISYTIKKNIDCGKHIIKNIAHGTTDQDKTEDNNNNNENY